MESVPVNEPPPPETAAPPAAAADDAVRYEPSGEVPASSPAPQKDEARDEDSRLVYHWRTPLILLACSAVSIFFAGCCRWVPVSVLGECVRGQVGELFDFMPARVAVLEEWRTGLIFMFCMLGFLIAHELGHFIMTVVYRVRATLPFVLPFPVSPIGTVGAVIAMEPGKANRREIFDIGIAGPLAGLIVALPILHIGIQHIDFAAPASGMLALKPPLLIDWWLHWVHPTQWKAAGGEIWLSQANAYLVAAIFGIFFTGLNMFPVGQLDGGHITYCLFGRGAHWLARGLMVLSFAYMSYTGNTLLLLMALLAMLMGTDHPKTSDDDVPLGWPRVVLGWASLIIPIVCLTPDFIR